MDCPYVSCVIDRKRATGASYSRKPRVNRSSGSKVIASGSRRERRKNWLGPILQPTLAQFSLIPSRKRGMKWLRCVGSSLIYSFNEWQSRNFAVWSGSGQTFSEGVRFRAQDIIYSIAVCSCPFLIVLHSTQFTSYSCGQKSRGSQVKTTLKDFSEIK
ncbi:hypothetical protein PIB30_045800 [Stylosanthes scabra]|uniref:Uncharacterized protein n=1 Tax=Stylosanthes scabra TaxID=79078 RepID=A0ABU6ZF05_9FABA|nr:hypothetical protein [Stylosanthes scabra]